MTVCVKLMTLNLYCMTADNIKPVLYDSVCEADNIKPVLYDSVCEADDIKPVLHDS